MRKIPLKQVDEEEFSFHYKSMLRLIFVAPKGTSTNYDEMRLVIPIIDKLDAADDTDTYILLEDAEWNELRDRIKSFKFTRNTKGLMNFIDEILGAELVKVEVKDDTAEKNIAAEVGEHKEAGQ